MLFMVFVKIFDIICLSLIVVYISSCFIKNNLIFFSDNN